jgi:putative SOS response-associated peptidase YedK
VASRTMIRADNVGIIAPNYNVAPGDPQPVIRRSRETGERELVLMRWGIVSWFAKSEDEFKALSTINAKSDNLTSSKMWREPFAKRRCLVPASGLYEWPKEGHAISPTYTPGPTANEASDGSVDLFGTTAPAKKNKKVPKPIKRVFAITTVEPGPFAFAGIWDAWKRPDGTYLETFAIVTTEPNELVAQIHDRLALILHPLQRLQVNTHFKIRMIWMQSPVNGLNLLGLFMRLRSDPRTGKRKLKEGLKRFSSATTRAETV